MLKVMQPMCIICNRVLHRPIHAAKKSNIWKTRLQQQHQNLSLSVCVLNQEPKLNISDACVKQMKKVATDNEFLRVFVEGGGCSGFQYKFELDSEPQDDDRTFERDGVKVVSDETSLELLDGSTVDYEEELIKSAFRIKDNPRSKTSCSCGVSFDVQL